MSGKTLVTNWVHSEVLDLLATLGPVDANERREPWPRDDLLRRAKDAEAILAFMTDYIDAQFLDACPKLRIIACALKGADNFDADACKARGIKLTIVPDLLTVPTAELAIGLMIALGRNILIGDNTIRKQPYEGWRPVLYGSGLDGADVGIIGMGAVGQAIAHRLRSFRCRLLYCDSSPAPPDREDMLGLLRCDFPELIARSDFLVLALPLTSTTKHLIDAVALSKVKSGAFLINPARGSLVDEAAVANALESGRLGGYAADVFETEDWAHPDRPSGVNSRLLANPRTVLTPHIGSAVDRVRRDIALAAAREIVTYRSECR
ncbi:MULTISPECIES: phosphonate dehydrogenase [Alphaproteobacteria]|uniref:Hydroxyacid dehydrogenase n=1 Tax=Roseibium aggregatum TaxID=187304 RepID=A0A939ECW6_9HYPH|nr:phosphonate dehydrogenase [Roseibium aggregatum]MBN9670252.1 hydroxyacid dehydrogenase [Roseibium aggregatum]